MYFINMLFVSDDCMGVDVCVLCDMGSIDIVCKKKR